MLRSGKESLLNFYRKSGGSTTVQPRGPFEPPPNSIYKRHHRGRMIPPSNYNKHTLVDDLDCSAVGAGNNIDMETISIDNACRTNATQSMTRREKTSGDALEEYMDVILSTSAIGSYVEDTIDGNDLFSVTTKYW